MRFACAPSAPTSVTGSTCVAVAKDATERPPTSEAWVIKWAGGNTKRGPNKSTH